MSEPIQSIATGTYMIGETSATNFEAGTGISITQPSAGTVRISSDETLLWEGTLGATGTDIIMSESVKNFERLKVFIQCKTNSTGRCKMIREIEPTFSTGSPISLNYFEAYDRASTTTTMNMIYLQFTDETTGSLLGGSKWVNNAFTNSITTYDFNIVKIVGVNRKENA